jgi:hypothetical protein
MSEEQVLEHEVVPASEDLAEGREEESDKFEHPHGLVDPAARVLPPYTREGGLALSAAEVEMDLSPVFPFSTCYAACFACLAPGSSPGGQASVNKRRLSSFTDKRPKVLQTARQARSKLRHSDPRFDRLCSSCAASEQRR